MTEIVSMNTKWQKYELEKKEHFENKLKAEPVYFNQFLDKLSYSHKQIYTYSQTRIIENLEKIFYNDILKIILSYNEIFNVEYLQFKIRPNNSCNCFSSKWNNNLFSLNEQIREYNIHFRMYERLDFIDYCDHDYLFIKMYYLNQEIASMNNEICLCPLRKLKDIKIKERKKRLNSICSEIAQLLNSVKKVVNESLIEI